MQPAEIAHSYDSIAHQWLEPFLETNGIHQHEHALQFRPPGGVALDVGSGCSGRFIRLLEKNGYQVEGLDLSVPLMTGNFFGCELGEVGGHAEDDRAGDSEGAGDE
jgi:hypothetical protein